MTAHDTYNNNSYKSRRGWGAVGRRRKESESKRELGETIQLYRISKKREKL